MEKISFIFCIVFLVTGLAHAATFDSGDKDADPLREAAHRADPNYDENINKLPKEYGPPPGYKQKLIKKPLKKIINPENKQESGTIIKYLKVAAMDSPMLEKMAREADPNYDENTKKFPNWSKIYKLRKKQGKPLDGPLTPEERAYDQAEKQKLLKKPR